MSVSYQSAQKQHVRITLDLQVLNDFNARDIDFSKLFELEPTENVEVYIEEFDRYWNLGPLKCPSSVGTALGLMIFPLTETRPFFVQQAKSGRWNVWVFQRETESGHKYSVQQTLKTPDDAYSWGLRYINTVTKSY